jgi:L-alanine-DL-glutamate epimerase-like enolase superfamily enzyme
VKPSDIRVDEVRYEYEEYRYRTPIKFGGVALDRATLVNIGMTVRTRDGRSAHGFGSMPLGNVWSFPSRQLPYDETLTTMRALVERIARSYVECGEYGHPIDLSAALEPVHIWAAGEFSRTLAEPIPRLCTLVAASAIDAALHDAFGKIHRRNCYQTYGPDLMSHDLGHYLGERFRGEWLPQYLLSEPRPRMPLYHLVGALDPLEEGDLSQRVGDGLPETLSEWIHFNGLTHLKIKLNGDDLAWDVERVMRVDRVTAATQQLRGINEWCYSLDFNERCANVEYLLEFMHRLRARAPRGFERIQYIEQPTARDLTRQPAVKVHEAAKLLPVVIDESLVDLESLYLAKSLGYTGVALKACKGQTQSLLLAAAAQREGMFLCVQDLTCPGASLIHSAGLAAHVPGVAAIEANARQYMPAANATWEERFPGLFRVRDGTMETGSLTGLGLSASR